MAGPPRRSGRRPAATAAQRAISERPPLRARSGPVPVDPVDRTAGRPGTPDRRAMYRWNGRVVWIPVTWVSSRTPGQPVQSPHRGSRRRRGASRSAGRSRVPRACRPPRPMSTRTPGPPGISQRPIRARGRGELACRDPRPTGGPRSRDGWARPPGSRRPAPPRTAGTPAAIQSCSRTMSTPADELGHAVLHLESGVDLEEPEPPVLVEQELGRRRVLESGGRGAARTATCVQLAPLVVGQARRRRLLDELLVPPLEGAVALPDRDDRAARVAEELDLDVARRSDLALEVDRAVAERGRAPRPSPQRGPPAGRPHGDAAHAPASPAGRRLDEQREADRLGLRDDRRAASSGRSTGAGSNVPGTTGHARPRRPSGAPRACRRAPRSRRSTGRRRRGPRPRPRGRTTRARPGSRSRGGSPRPRW